MLLSHKHRFIFFKTRKTAGTSFEILLSPFMGRDDVITPTNIGDEFVRLQRGATPRNFLHLQPAEPLTETKLRELRTQKEFEQYLDRDVTVFRQFRDHMTAGEIKTRVPPIIWENYTKISITRHPYEVLVSGAYFYLAAKMPRTEISHAQLLETIDALIADPRLSNYVSVPNYQIYSIAGAVAADVMIRHSHFEQDVRALLAKLSLPADAPIPQLKTQFRQDKRPAHDILTPAQKKSMYEANAREFEAFGYEK